MAFFAVPRDCWLNTTRNKKWEREQRIENGVQEEKIKRFRAEFGVILGVSCRGSDPMLRVATVI